MIDLKWALAIFPYILIGFSLFFLVFYLLKKRNNFLDLRDIFCGHLAIFKKSKYQIFIFFIIPVIMSVGLACLYKIDSTIIDNLNIIFSIFISMFFAIISVLTAFNQNKTSSFIVVLKQTYNSVIFEIVLSIFTLILSIIYKLILNLVCEMVRFVYSIVIYSFVIIILLNMIVVIKRLKRLFDENLNTSN